MDNDRIGEFAYFVASVGAAVYFVQQSDGFWGFLFAILKALVWPGFIAYYGLQGLGA